MTTVPSGSEAIHTAYFEVESLQTVPFWSLHILTSGLKGDYWAYHVSLRAGALPTLYNIGTLRALFVDSIYKHAYVYIYIYTYTYIYIYLPTYIKVLMATPRCRSSGDDGMRD